MTRGPPKSRFWRESDAYIEDLKARPQYHLDYLLDATKDKPDWHRVPVSLALLRSLSIEEDVAR